MVKRSMIPQSSHYRIAVALEHYLNITEDAEPTMKPFAARIPISAAKRIADAYGYEQVVIMARHVGEGGSEHVTTYGKTKQHCAVAARMGDHLKRIMQWPEGAIGKMKKRVTQ